MQVLQHSKVEPSLAGAAPGTVYQFERKGFFCVDLDSKPGLMVFNQTVPLRDSWAKIEAQAKAPEPPAENALYHFFMTLWPAALTAGRLFPTT